MLVVAAEDVWGDSRGIYVSKTPRVIWLDGHISLRKQQGWISAPLQASLHLSYEACPNRYGRKSPINNLTSMHVAYTLAERLSEAFWLAERGERRLFTANHLVKGACSSSLKRGNAPECISRSTDAV